MKHFWHKTIELSQEEKEVASQTAYQKLRKKPLSVPEMEGGEYLIAFNSNAMGEYIPVAFSKTAITKTIDIPDLISRETIPGVLSKIPHTSPILGFVLENIQTKEVQKYFNLIFSLNIKQEIKPVITCHLTAGDLVGYLSQFLAQTEEDGQKRKLEFFHTNGKEPWSVFQKASEVLKLETQRAKPVILDKPFFSEIQLVLKQSEQNKIGSYTFGSLRGILGAFNKRKEKSGAIIKSMNTLYLKPSDIAGIKLASIQSKNLMGVCVEGNYILKQNFISAEIGLNFITFEQIDYFRVKYPSGLKEIYPDAISTIEVNLDTQQVFLVTEVSEKELHVDNIKQVRLHIEENSALIDKVFLFEPGSSETESMQQYFMHQLQMMEMQRIVKQSMMEGAILKQKNIVAGDVMSQLVLANMERLEFFPKTVPCYGFKPEDICNYENLKEHWAATAEELKALFSKIIDVSQTPEFSKHNFEIRTRSIAGFIKKNGLDDFKSPDLRALLGELDQLVQYMDDFFKLDVYKAWNSDLDTDHVPEDSESKNTDELETAPKLDQDAKNFIAENFFFFKKREDLQKAILLVEGLLFFKENIQPAVSKNAADPDLVLYSKNSYVREHFGLTALPALSLQTVASSDIFKFDDRMDELQFIQFMRGFADKVFQATKKLDTTFHHQYKHTISELGFILQEKLTKLKEQLEELESPENREEVYKKLLEDITRMFQENLQNKEQGIENLKQELVDIQEKIISFRKELSDLLGNEVTPENLKDVMDSIPPMLEEMKQQVLEMNQEKKKQLSEVIKVIQQFRNMANKYYTTLLNYSGQYFQAQTVREKVKMMYEVHQLTSRELFKATPEQLKKKKTEWEKSKHDAKTVNELKEAIGKIQKNLKEQILKFRIDTLGEVFNEKNWDSGNLSEYIEWFTGQIKEFYSIIEKQQEHYIRFTTLETQLHKKQGEMVDESILAMKNRLLIQIADQLLENPDDRETIKKMLSRTENIPKEIKEELGEIRSEMNQVMKSYKQLTLEDHLEGMQDYTDIHQVLLKRDNINAAAKELVNLVQGESMVIQEIKGEEEDLEFLRSQEDKLEQVAMGKVLPSTRVLLKNQYIPQVEKDIVFLNKANAFLTELTKIGEKLWTGMSNVFFRRRYGVQHFLYGLYCFDEKAVIKSHTAKNIYATMAQMADMYPQACAVAKTLGKVGLKKASIVGKEGFKSLIEQAWTQNTGERFLYIPPTFSIMDALDVCEYKEKLVQKHHQIGWSSSSLILIYLNEIDFQEIENSEALMERYHQAILSNLFINIDGVQIFNNRDSIFEGVVRQTFGNCTDKLAHDVIRVFFAQ